MEEMWFQQDGATAHTARASMSCSTNVSATRSLAFRRCPGPHAHQIYLPAISFFGVTSNQKFVFENLVQSTNKVSIREETATVPQKMLVNVMQNFEERLRTCVRMDAIFPI